MTIKYYQNKQGREPFLKWRNSIKDLKIIARIDNRLERVRVGNLGDYNSVGDGVFELRLHFGAGYRIYYGYIGKQMLLLIVGGGKKTQTKDIKKAKQFWQEYKKSIQ